MKIVPTVEPSQSPTLSNEQMSTAQRVVETVSVPAHAPTPIPIKFPPTDSPYGEPEVTYHEDHHDTTSASPTDRPSMPTHHPSPDPSPNPSPNPSRNPSPNPTTIMPSLETLSSSDFPSYIPNYFPSYFPSDRPTDSPTNVPIYSTETKTKTTLTPNTNPNPTSDPTSDPSGIPIVLPTMLPTMLPIERETTFSPSVAPTQIPTQIPTQTPLDINIDSSSSDTSDDKVTQLIATGQFSNDYGEIEIIFSFTNISCGFNSYRDTIDTYYSYSCENVLITPLGEDCNDIFSDETNELLSTNARCNWMNDGFTILIELSGYSNISINSSLMLDIDAFTVVIDDEDEKYNLNINEKDMFINKIIAPDDPIEPELVISGGIIGNKIGICDDLILDARDSTNLGNRAASFIWIINNQEKYEGKYVNIPNTQWRNLITTQTTTTTTTTTPTTITTDVLTITVKLSTWYNSEDIVSYNITIYDSIVPQVYISGPTVFKTDDVSGNYQNGIATFYGQVSFSSNFSCLTNITNDDSDDDSQIDIESSSDDDNDNDDSDEELSLTSLTSYNIKWSLVETSGDGVIDNQSVNDYFSSLDETTDSISISMTNWLTVGYSYEISLLFECNISGFSCESVMTTHIIYYDFSSIVCQISGGSNKLIQNVDQSTLEAYIMSLDGYTWTYDPDSINQFNKSHLAFEWSCWYYITYDDIDDFEFYYYDCNSSISAVNDTDDSDSIGKAEMTMVDILSETMYEIEENDVIIIVELHVHDKSLSDDQKKYSSSNRAKCLSYQTVTLHNIMVDDFLSWDEFPGYSNYSINYDTASIATTQTEIPVSSKILDVSLTPIQTIVNKNDRIRLIVTINNGDENEMYYYTWTESNGYLTTQEIDDLRVDSQSSKNLVLEASSLESGLIYSFNVIVFNDDNSHYGTSNVEIYINNDVPTIVDGSFIIEPNCQQIVNSFDDVFDLSFSLNVEADSDNVPLYYQFSYVMNDREETTFLLHGSLLTDAYIDGM